MVEFRAGDSVALTNLLDNGLDSDTSFRLGGGTRYVYLLSNQSIQVLFSPRPALCLAVEHGHAKMVRLLLERWNANHTNQYISR